jgi:hypothetical protein
VAVLQHEDRNALLHGRPAEMASVQANMSGIYHLDGEAFYLAK